MGCSQADNSGLSLSKPSVTRLFAQCELNGTRLTGGKESGRDGDVLMNFPFQKLALTCLALFCAFITPVQGQTNSHCGWYWVEDLQQRGRGLPPGVARMVDTNGNVEDIDRSVTSQAYQHEAFHLLIEEANQAAQALQLEEDLPITRSKISGARINRFGFFYTHGLLGFVATTNYTYRALRAGKLDTIEIDHSYEVWRGLQDELFPENQVDNQAAYQLATQWLASLSVDVKALNRDCQLTVASSPVLNYVGSGKEPIRRMFAPTYDVMWKSSNGPAAGVQLYLPDKLLIQLNIEDPKYNLRPPIIFTNLAALFPGTALIHTNYPVSPTVLGALWSPPGTEVTFITDSNQPEPFFHDYPLSRYIQTQTRLNPKHLSLAQLMAMKLVSGPDEWGVVTFELPARFNAFHSDQPIPGGTLDLGSFDADGNFIECTLFDCEPASDGKTRISWNINWNSPGRHDLRARLTYAHGMDGDQFNLIGPVFSYYSGNSCRFYEDSTLFTSDGANLYAKLREPAATFRVEVRSLKGRLVNNVTGTTTNGEINLAWDLTGIDGKKYTNNSFIGSFYVTYPDDTSTNPPVKAQFNKIGTSGD